MKSNYLIKTICIVFMVTINFTMNSCEEGAEILAGLKLFQFEYKFSDNVTDHTFTPEIVGLAVGQSNQINIYQLPTSANQQILIRMERNGTTDQRYIRYITIDVTGPPVSVGQVYTGSGYIELVGGEYTLADPPKYTTQNISNTNFTVEITEYNTSLKRIGGNFTATVRHKTHPQDSASVLIRNGTFTYPYQ